MIEAVQWGLLFIVGWLLAMAVYNLVQFEKEWRRQQRRRALQRVLDEGLKGKGWKWYGGYARLRDDVVIKVQGDEADRDNQ